MVDLSGLNLGGINTLNPMNTMNTINPMNNIPQNNQNLLFNNTPNLNLGINSVNSVNSTNTFNFDTLPITTSEPVMKQIFKNNDLTVYSQLSHSNDRSTITGSFLISNNLDKNISNIKMNLSVKKHVNCKVISTSGASLEPRKSLGIKKVWI